jgi:alpha-glucosidase (family GH31 glycosyl hydrolase)
MPYIWTEAQEAVASGLPMVRALVLDDPGDPNVAFIDDEYLFGRNILVAPILDARDHRHVYLPRGSWVELGSGTAHAGARWIEAHAPLDRVPLYVRAGSVLPMGPLMQHVDELPLDPLQLWIHEPAASGGYRIRDARGDIDVRYRLDRDALTVAVDGAPGEIEVVVPGRSARLLERSRRGTTDVLTVALGDAEA